MATAEKKLSEMKCTPCQGGVEPFGPDKARQYMQQIDPQWELVEDKKIKRTFKFDDFRGAFEFVKKVGELAEQHQHHPNISFTWGKATISLSTHKINGLHENDFIMASKIDRL